MIITLSEPVQKPLEQTELVVITEQVDDVVLLLGQMMKMGLPEIVDDYLPRHWRQEGLSWGWTATTWLAYVGESAWQRDRVRAIRSMASNKSPNQRYIVPGRETRPRRAGCPSRSARQ